MLFEAISTLEGLLSQEGLMQGVSYSPGLTPNPDHTINLDEQRMFLTASLESPMWWISESSNRQGTLYEHNLVLLLLI